jgi:formyl-CoA transferase
LSAGNPRLIYCSITGYGQTGPYRDRPGYDFIIQAQGGLMSITGPVDGEPHKVGVAIVDITAGLFAATAILAALHERERSGQGQYIDVALLDAQVAWLANVAQNYLATSQTPGRFGNAHPSIVPYEPFPTADGSVAVAVGSDDQYRRFCLAAGRPDLWDDVRFRTNASRVTHRAELISLLCTLFLTRSTEEWITLLLDIGVPVGAINTVAQALDDPQVLARAMVREVDHPTVGRIKLLGPVPKFSRSETTVTAPPPLGYHTAEILAERLGYADDEIAELRRQRTI